MKRDTKFLYTKLANNLREQILSGYIKPGEFLLSEFALAKHYGLSRISVRKSLEILSAEGLVVKKAGQGTMVPVNLQLPRESNRTLNVITTSPSIFSENCLAVIIDEFKKNFPNTTVRVLNIPIIMFWQSVRDLEKSGLNPDVLLVTDSDIHDMEYRSPFLDLSETVKDCRSQFYTKLLISKNEADGSIEAVPVTFSTVYLAYNPVLFEKYNVEKPGKEWTREAFIETARKLTLDTDGDGINDQYGFSFIPIMSRWPIIAMQNGVDFNCVKDYRQPLFDTLNFIHDLLFRWRVAVLHQRWSQNLGPFFNSKSAMTLTSSLELANLKNNQMAFYPKVAPMPFGKNDSTMLITNSFMVPASANSAELAQAFIKVALSNQVQETICDKFRFLSVLKHINQGLLSKSYLKLLNIVNPDLSSSFFMHEVFPEPTIISELETEMEPFWFGLESAASTTDRLIQIIGSRDE